jgi:hypothetical protein
MRNPSIQCEKLANKLDPILSALYDIEPASIDADADENLSRAYQHLERAADALRAAARAMTEAEVL